MRPAAGDALKPEVHADNNNSATDLQPPSVQGLYPHDMEPRGGTGAIARAAVPSPPRPGPSSTTTFARTSSCASPSPRDAPGRAERPCMAFWMDAGQVGVKETARAPRLPILVARLGKRDASSCYKKSSVTARSGGCVWEKCG